MKQKTPDLKKEENCSCCGRYLKNPKHTSHTNKIIKNFCKKCGISHLANVMSEPNYEEIRASAIADVLKIINNQIEFNSKEIIKHFNNNKKKPSKIQVRKEIKHRTMKSCFEWLKATLEAMKNG